MGTKSDVYNAIDAGRRRFLTTAAIAVAGAHLGAMRAAPMQSGRRARCRKRRGQRVQPASDQRPAC